LEQSFKQFDDDTIAGKSPESALLEAPSVWMVLRNHWLKLVVAVLGCQSVGYFSSLVTIPVIPAWYSDLLKPELTPPTWAFAPVWMTLYTMMSLAFFWVWASRHPARHAAVACFLLQLLLNGLWSFLFFDMQNPLWGLVDIVFLWVAIGLTIRVFWPISRVAALLLVPYFIWVGFAAWLNWQIWILNPLAS
jgi:translocator protein